MTEGSVIRSQEQHKIFVASCRTISRSAMAGSWFAPPFASVPPGMVQNSGEINALDYSYEELVYFVLEYPLLAQTAVGMNAKRYTGLAVSGT
ncbi:hypothetical protein N7492_002769 [Penicillium capsulatum]|uniref:Uncharacterized protein n=1 Tax=Penicillium capsulatum TaxID=69766 RepID=A0A9W9LWB5_9EURO|nr:hypothetical protein N7492_002769 [Penicillium capsulatum]KAJ6122633.1 hypothetical protein N7512_005098 [Penicillium capsulatum]